mmetsp:Transcript_9129/g.20953  ORF Transcript_9129/g.20953 Transcript_9129/m.20953 type:complete len:317 (+) Transcript_9129:3903-4853(+)
MTHRSSTRVLDIFHQLHELKLHLGFSHILIHRERCRLLRLLVTLSRVPREDVAAVVKHKHRRPLHLQNIPRELFCGLEQGAADPLGLHVRINGKHADLCRVLSSFLHLNASDRSTAALVAVRCKDRRLGILKRLKHGRHVDPDAVNEEHLPRPSFPSVLASICPVHKLHKLLRQLRRGLGNLHMLGSRLFNLVCLVRRVAKSVCHGLGILRLLEKHVLRCPWRQFCRLAKQVLGQRQILLPLGVFAFPSLTGTHRNPTKHLWGGSPQRGRMEEGGRGALEGMQEERMADDHEASEEQGCSGHASGGGARGGGAELG